MAQTESTLELNGRTITLIGTAHISKESIDEVTAYIRAHDLDCVAIELDAQRLASLNDKERWRKMDIIKVLKNKQGFLLLANLVLAGFQRRMGANMGVNPGDEMKAAYETATERGIKTVMVDRPIQVTLRRAWARNSLWGKCKLLAALLTSAFEKETVDSEQIENLKNRSEMDSMMSELSEYMPKVKEVLIDERDRYLAAHIWNAEGTRVAAVLGAGHLPGVERNLRALAAGEASADTADIAAVPPKTTGAKIAGWVIPALIVALIAAGFYFGGKQKAADMLGTWVLWNGALAAIGTLIAAGHPLTVLTAFVGAPITSLCPLIGVGMVTGIVQAVLKKPKVADMETLQDDVTSLRGFYRNRILRVLLVFILSSIGSTAGTFVAGANFIATITAFVQKLFA
ncbi:MAG: TraB/GumN family protein [Treponemataceae bacterium]|nr:TraB/GumN family protein [Treponemataceae bacterium]MDE7391164.1 TraB/GumN family protein [Treponemataceae bacterium]